MITPIRLNDKGGISYVESCIYNLTPKNNTTPFLKLVDAFEEIEMDVEDKLM